MKPRLRPMTPVTTRMEKNHDGDHKDWTNADNPSSKGRAKKRLTYTRRFVNVQLTGGKRKVRLMDNMCWNRSRIYEDRGPFAAKTLMHREYEG